MSRTEELSAKIRTLSYEHERLLSMHKTATDKAANAEREMNTHKSRLAYVPLVHSVVQLLKIRQICSIELAELRERAQAHDRRAPADADNAARSSSTTFCGYQED